MAEFLGLFGGGMNRVNNGGPECSVLQSAQAGDGSSSWRGNAVAEFGWMEAGLCHHGGGSENGLGGKLKGLGTWDSFEKSTIGKCLNKGVDVGGAAARGAGNGIEEGFLDLAGYTD